MNLKKHREIENMRRCLLIVDVQNDFLPGGSLAVADGDKVVGVINKMMDDFDLVIATQDWHPANHGSFAASHEGVAEYDLGELGGLEQCFWPVHCVAGTYGAELSHDLNLNKIDHIVKKGEDVTADSYSGFYDNGGQNDTGLADLLRENHIDEIVVTGLALDYCVKYTALDAIDEGFITSLMVQASRAVNVDTGDDQKAIQVMRDAGVEIEGSLTL